MIIDEEGVKSYLFNAIKDLGVNFLDYNIEE